jgi:hypothetical protein
MNLILDGQRWADRPGHGWIPYPEWDHRRHTYRDAWCLVKELLTALRRAGARTRVRVTADHQPRQFATLIVGCACVVNRWAMSDGMRVTGGGSRTGHTVGVDLAIGEGPARYRRVDPRESYF